MAARVISKNAIAILERRCELVPHRHVGRQAMAQHDPGSVLAIDPAIESRSVGFNLHEASDGAGLWGCLVGATGFEPATPCLPDKCANRAAPRPDRNGADYRDAPSAAQPFQRRLS